MSEELYEVAFSGEIAAGAEREQVKAKVGAMFKADPAKLVQLFSGKRVVIKKNINQPTANKYKTALNNAGAICEITCLSGADDKPAAKQAPAVPAAKAAAAENRPSPAATVAKKPAKAVYSGDVPEAPKTAPLGITANDIEDLSAAIAPPGSDMQDEIKVIAAPDVDVSGLGMAPPGSDLGELKKGEAPPPPDTSGLSLVDS